LGLNCSILEYLPGENIFYIVSPKDVVMAKPRDLDDHITWLLERERYEEALQAAEANKKLLNVHNIMEIGQKYLAHLVKKGVFLRPHKPIEQC